IHGLVRWASWTVAEREPHRVVLEHLLHPEPGYPFSLALRVEYALGEGGLTVTTHATNVGSEPWPFGSGRPRCSAPAPPTAAALTVTVPARTVIPAGPRGLPGDAHSVDGTEYDFRRPRQLGATRLDNTFTDLDRDTDGRASVHVRDDAGGAELTVWADAAYTH